MTAYRRSAASAFVALVAVAVLSGCSPFGRSETVEVSSRSDDALVLGDGTTEVLGISAEAPPSSVLEPAPVTTPPLLEPTTTMAPPPSTVAPPPSVAPAPPTTAPAPPSTVPAAAASVAAAAEAALVIPPLGPNAARALQGLTRPDSIDVAARALGLISFDWRNGLPGWELRFLDGRSGYRGLTYPEASVIEVFVRPGDTAEGLAHVVAHELGHAVDVSRLSDADRAEWAAARGYGSQAPWWVASGGSDFASGAGDFAESFAFWQAAGGQWFGDLAGPPNPAQVGLLARLTYGP